MHLPLTFSAAVLLTSFVTDTIAAPSVIKSLIPKLFRRVGLNNGASYFDAIDLDLDCTGLEDICNFNAYVILCKGADRTLQRGPGTPSYRSLHYRESGASWNPFRKFNSGACPNSGVFTPPNSGANNNIIWDSPDEYPWASTTQGGWGSFLFPAPQGQQSTQGGKINAAYQAFGVQTGQWFRIRNLLNCPRVYCTALNTGDTSVCKRKVPPITGILDVARYIFRRRSGPHVNPMAYGYFGKPDRLLRRKEIEHDGLSLLSRDDQCQTDQALDLTLDDIEQRDLSDEEEKAVTSPNTPDVSESPQQSNTILVARKDKGPLDGASPSDVRCFDKSYANIPEDGTYRWAEECMGDLLLKNTVLGTPFPGRNGYFCQMENTQMGVCSYGKTTDGDHNEIDEFNQLADQKCGMWRPASLLISGWAKKYYRGADHYSSYCPELALVDGHMEDVSGKNEEP